MRLRTIAAVAAGIWWLRRRARQRQAVSGDGGSQRGARGKWPHRVAGTPFWPDKNGARKPEAAPHAAPPRGAARDEPPL